MSFINKSVRDMVSIIRDMRFGISKVTHKTDISDHSMTYSSSNVAKRGLR